MKKIVYSLALMSFVFAGLTSCKSNTEKQEDAVEDVQQAQEKLDDVQAEAKTDSANAEANKAEWEAFKQDVDATISRNEQRIAEMKQDIKKQGKKIDAGYQKNVDELEQKNENLKAKLKDWETDKKTDWQSFKREFDADMSDLGDALKNFTINNKK